MRRIRNVIKQKKGFTLIELIVVIAVIGILVLLAAPKFLGYTKDAKLAQIQNDVKAYEDAIVSSIIESEAEGVDQLKEWNWNVADINILQDYVDEGSLVNKKGTVSELTDNTFYEVDTNDISVNSKLTGEVFYSEGGSAYYHYESAEGESEEIPNDFTLLTDDDFDFIDDDYAPNEYTIDGVPTQGFFAYTGVATKIILPEKIMGNVVRDYFFMFMGTEVTAVAGDSLHVTDMSAMFTGSGGESLDVSRLKTDSVRNMDTMFSNASATDFNLSNWNTSNVTNMKSMFAESQATSLDLSSFDTSSVTNTTEMFRNTKITEGFARTEADARRFNNGFNEPDFDEPEISVFKVKK